MANRCAGLDPTWAHLPAPALTQTSSSWLFPAAAFENEVLTCALRASVSPATATAIPCSSSYPTTPTSSSISSASEELLSGAHDAPQASRPPAPATGRPKIAGGRVTKRKPRPSRRPPVTYITADPANFRRMVQEITGFPVVASSGAGVRRKQAATASAGPSPSWPAAEPACALPTLDTSAFLLDRAVETTSSARVPEDKSSSGSASPAMAVAAVAAVDDDDDDDDASVLQELEAIACDPAFVSGFPTLESWGII